MLPDGNKNSVIYNENAVLNNIFIKVCSTRDLNIADYEIRDESGETLDLNLTLGRIEVPRVKLVKKSYEPPLAPLEPELQEVINQVKWLRPFVLQMVQLSNRAHPVFNQELKTVMDSQRKEKKLSFIPVPWAIRLLSDEIILQGLRTEGIGRVPGAGSILKKLIGSIDTGEFSEIENTGPEELMDVWKRYFRDLPSPLLPPEILETNNLPQNEKANFALKILQAAPQDVQGLIKELFYVMHKISLASSLNKMTVRNLATVIAMSEFLCLGDQLQREDLSEFLLENFHQIFNQIKPECPAVVPTSGSLQVFVGPDSSVRSVILTAEQHLLSQCRFHIEKKSSLKTGDSWENWSFYAVCDREVRLLTAHENLLPFVNTGTLLFFTNTKPKPVVTEHTSRPPSPQLARVASEPHLPTIVVDSPTLLRSSSGSLDYDREKQQPSPDVPRRSPSLGALVEDGSDLSASEEVQVQNTTSGEGN